MIASTDFLKYLYKLIPFEKLIVRINPKIQSLCLISNQKET